MSKPQPPFVFEVYPTRESALHALAGPDRTSVPLRWVPDRLRAVDVGNVTVLHMPSVWGMGWEVLDEIAEEIKGLVGDHGRHRLLLDLGEVPLAHSGFLNMLVRILRTVANAGGVLALCEMNAMVAEVMHICALPLVEHMPA